MRHIDEIIIHTTATSPNWRAGHPTADKVAEVRRWHVDDNGWSDIGYHFLIDRDGTVAPGRPVARAGAHVRGHNANSIAIALFGGRGSSAVDMFADNFTPEQDRALRALITELQTKHPGAKKVSGHNEYANKACPGFNVKRWLKSAKPRTSPAQSSTIQAAAASAVAATGTATSALSALSALDSVAQYMILGFTGVVIVGALWIMRERLRRWARGDR